MKCFAIGMLGAVAGFFLLALCSYAAIQLFSSNTHDRAMEAAMTAFFVAGPLGGLIGGILGARFSRQPPSSTTAK